MGLNFRAFYGGFLMDFISNCLYISRKIKIGAIAVVLAGLMLPLCADQKTDIYYQLNNLVESSPQKACGSHAETVVKTIINILGDNINYVYRNASQNETASTENYEQQNTLFFPLLEKCLKKGLNPNLVYTDGTKMTPLHHAAFLGLAEVVKLLLAHGADYKAVDGKGHAARWYADPATHAEMSKDLQPKYSLIIPFLGTAFAYGAYMYWLDHQLCYELLMRAENHDWKPVITIDELMRIKKDVHSDQKKLVLS